MMEIVQDYCIVNLKNEQEKGRMIVLYGAGISGIIIAKLLELCGIRANLFVDNNPNKRSVVIYNDIVCYLPKDVHNKESCIVFVAVAWEKADDTYFKAEEDGFCSFYHIQGIIDDILRNRQDLIPDLLQMLYDSKISNLITNYPKRLLMPGLMLNNKLNIHGERIAVYTSVFGQYDEVYIPKFKSENIDYYYISDIKPEVLGEFRWIEGNKVVPKGLDSPIKRNRFVKMHPHTIFPQYKYSIYIDGVIEIIDDITDYLKESRTGISAFRYYNRDCLYYEAFQMANYKRVIIDDLYSQITRYLDEGYPLHYGMTEMPVIAREHGNPVCIKIMEGWWDEFYKTSQRDQLSFMYVMWKNGYGINDVAFIGTDFRETREYIYHSHIKDSKGVSNDVRDK